MKLKIICFLLLICFVFSSSACDFKFDDSTKEKEEENEEKYYIGETFSYKDLDYKVLSAVTNQTTSEGANFYTLHIKFQVINNKQSETEISRDDFKVILLETKQEYTLSYFLSFDVSYHQIGSGISKESSLTPGIVYTFDLLYSVPHSLDDKSYSLKMNLYLINDDPCIYLFNRSSDN